jgi:hypothetical protein
VLHTRTVHRCDFRAHRLLTLDTFLHMTEAMGEEMVRACRQ